MEDEVLANAGVDVFEEVFKLIFTKLYDEYLSRKDKGILNYFTKQVTKTAVGESTAVYGKGEKPGYLDGSDYEALKAAGNGIQRNAHGISSSEKSRAPNWKSLS